MDIKLFFSWQLDTDSKKLHQTAFIRTCIQTAIAKVNKELKHVNIEYQEGVKGVSGAPDIVPEIEERISKCHIFIGDLTFINQETRIIKFLKKYLASNTRLPLIQMLYENLLYLWHVLL